MRLYAVLDPEGDQLRLLAQVMKHLPHLQLRLRRLYVRQLSRPWEDLLNPPPLRPARLRRLYVHRA